MFLLIYILNMRYKDKIKKYKKLQKKKIKELIEERKKYYGYTEDYLPEWSDLLQTNVPIIELQDIIDCTNWKEIWKYAKKNNIDIANPLSIPTDDIIDLDIYMWEYMDIDIDNPDYPDTKKWYTYYYDSWNDIYWRMKWYYPYLKTEALIDVLTD